MLEATLRERLAGRGISEDAIHQVVNQLQKWGFLNDDRALSGWIEPFRTKPSGGPAKLAALLMRKGLEESLAIELAERAFADSNPVELASELLDKRKPKNPGQAYRYLLAQGIESEAAEIAVAGYFPDSD